MPLQKKTTEAKITFSFMGSSIWNKFSNDFKILNSTTSFTHNYKKLVTTYTIIIIIIIINTIIITIKWIVGAKDFVTVRYKTGFKIMGFFQQRT